MKHLLIAAVILIAAGLTGCQVLKKARVKVSRNRIERIIKKNPSLSKRDTVYQISHDTIKIVSPAYQFDTIVRTAGRDTILIETERFKTILVRTMDSLGWEVKTFIPADTVLIPVTDTLIKIRDRLVPEVVTKTKTPWWIWLFVPFFLIWTGVLLKKR